MFCSCGTTKNVIVNFLVPVMNLYGTLFLALYYETGAINQKHKSRSVYTNIVFDQQHNDTSHF